MTAMARHSKVHPISATALNINVSGEHDFEEDLKMAVSVIMKMIINMVLFLILNMNLKMIFKMVLMMF